MSPPAEGRPSPPCPRTSPPPCEPQEHPRRHAQEHRCPRRFLCSPRRLSHLRPPSLPPPPPPPPPPPAQPSTAPGQPRPCDSRDSPTTTPARLDASAPAELATPTVRGGQPWLPQAASAPARTGVAWRPAGHRQPARSGRPLPPAHLAGDRIPVPGDGDRGSTDGDGNRRTAGSRWRRSQGARQRTIEMSGQPQRVSHPVNRVCHMDDLSNPAGASAPEQAGNAADPAGSAVGLAVPGDGAVGGLVGSGGGLGLRRAGAGRRRGRWPCRRSRQTRFVPMRSRFHGQVLGLSQGACRVCSMTDPLDSTGSPALEVAGTVADPAGSAVGLAVPGDGAVGGLVGSGGGLGLRRAGAGRRRGRSSSRRGREPRFVPMRNRFQGQVLGLSQGACRVCSMTDLLDSTASPALDVAGRAADRAGLAGTLAAVGGGRAGAVPTVDSLADGRAGAVEQSGQGRFPAVFANRCWDCRRVPVGCAA